MERRDNPWNVLDKIVQAAMHRHRTAPVPHEVTNARQITVKLSDYPECGFDKRTNAELFQDSDNLALIRKCESQCDILFEKHTAKWDKKKITFNHTGAAPLLYFKFVVAVPKVDGVAASATTRSYATTGPSGTKIPALPLPPLNIHRYDDKKIECGLLRFLARV